MFGWMSSNCAPLARTSPSWQSLAFERRSADTDESLFGMQNNSSVELGDLPPVLLAECWNDLRTIAASGSGHDPDWEKKVEY